MKNKNALWNLDLPYNKLDNASVLITGGNGLIASGFIEALIEISTYLNLNTNLYVLCRNKDKAETRFDNYLKNKNFNLIIQDVIEPLNLNINFDYIVHAASSAHPTAFNTVPVDVMKANFIGTMNLLEYCKNNPKTRFMYVSSSEVYGENEQEKEIFSESDFGTFNHTRFRACYPESKRASETLSYCYEKQYGSDVVIVRPAFIYGKDIIADNTRADVYFLRQALNHENIIMYSEGSQIRSYCYITDCVSGMLYALLKGERGEIYNIGNNKCIVTMKEYAQKIADYGHVKLILDTSSQPKNTVFLKTTKLILDTTKLEHLGWKAMFTIDDGLADIFNRG